MWCLRHNGAEYGAWTVVSEDSDGSQDGKNLMDNYQSFYESIKNQPLPSPTGDTPPPQKTQ